VALRVNGEEPGFQVSVLGGIDMMDAIGQSVN
jgi:hypothetical protein